MFLVYIGFSLASKHRLKLSYIYETYSWAAPPFKGKLQMNLLWQRLWSKRSRIFINFIFCHIECYPENFGVKGRTTENWNMFAMVLRGCCKVRVWFRKLTYFLSIYGNLLKVNQMHSISTLEFPIFQVYFVCRDFLKQILDVKFICLDIYL